MKKILTIIIFSLLLFPVYAQIETFSENGKIGLKYKGQVVLLPEYEDITFGDIASIGNIYDHVVDVYDYSQYNVVVNRDDFENNSFCFKQNGYWGVMRPDEILIGPTYEKASIFRIEHQNRVFSNYELVRVKLNNKYGLITLGGQEILPLKYDEILLGFTLWVPKIKEDILCFATKVGGNLSITTLYEEELPIIFTMDDFKDKGKFKKLRKTILKEISKLYSINNEEFSKRAEEWINSCRTQQPRKTYKQKKNIRIGDSTYICEAIKYAGFKKHYGAVYKVNGKYGLCDKRRIITEPIYDEANYSGGGYWHIISKNGKYGLVNNDGKETIAPMYDKLSYVGNCTGEQWSFGWIYAAINNDIVNIVSPNNTIILSNIKWDKEKSDYENVKKNKKKIETACDIWNNSSEGERVHYQWKSNYDLLYNSTTDFPFLGIEDDGGVEKININGFEGRMYETGFIDIPFKYDQTDQILMRDPTNVFALKEKIDKTLHPAYYSHVYIQNYSEVCADLKILKQKKKAYDLLATLCEKKGYSKSFIFHDINERIQWMENKIYDYEVGIAETKGVIEFNQKVDHIANIGTSIINSITTAITDSGNEQGETFGLSDETTGGSGNYQAMYDKWERRAEKHYKSMTKSGSSKESKSEASGSTGSKMSGGNFVAQKRSFREAQKEMKQIREKARKSGVIIKQSKWETATIDY